MSAIIEELHLDTFPYDKYTKIAIIYACETFYQNYGLWPQAYDRYYIIGERHKYLQIQSGFKFTHIGGHCHEFGHCIGLPHPAEGNYENPREVDYYDLMEVGSMNGPSMDKRNGECPAGVNPFFKIIKGWVKNEDIHYVSGNTENLAIEYDYNHPKYYVVNRNGDLSDKFFILENRLREGFDLCTPNDPFYPGEQNDPNGNQGGLLIWRVGPGYNGKWVHLILADNEISDSYVHSNTDFENRSYSYDPFPIYQGQNCDDVSRPNSNWDINGNFYYSHYAFYNIKWDNINKKIILDIYTNAWSGTISSNTTWNSDVYIYGDLTVNSGVVLTINANVTVKEGVTFTINPGAQLKFASGKKITINGTINAQGIPENRIVFTSNAGSPAPGDWYGIVFSPTTSSSSRLAYCDIKYADYGVRVQRCAPIIANCRITNCLYGLYADYYSYPSLFNSEITNNNVYGSWMARSAVLSPSYVLFGNNGLSGGGGGGIYNRGEAYIRYCQISDNDGFGLYGDDESWTDLGGDSEDEMGFNNIGNNSDCEIVNGAYDPLPAMWNYWGSSSGPNPDDFSGEVEYTPYFTEEPGVLPWTLSKPIFREYRPDLALFRQGINLMKKAKYPEAVTVFKQIIEQYPNSNLLRFALNRWILTYSLQNQKMAIIPLLQAYLNRSVTSRFKNLIIENLVLAYRSAGEPNKALNIINQYIGSSELEEFLSYQKGQIYWFDLEDTAKALAAFEQYLCKYGKRPEAATVQLEWEKITERSLPKPAPPAKCLANSNGQMSLTCQPNPFNSVTTITYQLVEPADVKLSIYNIAGQRIEMLFNQRQAVGEYRISWDASRFGSGIYFFQLEAGGKIQTVKGLIVK